MTEEQEKQPDNPVSEVEQSVETQQEAKMVPLAALEAERHKRQEESQRRAELEQKNRLYEEYVQTLKQAKHEEEPEEDLGEFLTRGQFKQLQQQSKRELLEHAYCQAHPQIAKQVTQALPELIKQKPWVASVIENSPNRFAMAAELLGDLMPKKSTPDYSKKLEENSKKPGSPAADGKSAQLSKSDYLRSIAGKPEFREYRKKLLQGG